MTVIGSGKIAQALMRWEPDDERFLLSTLRESDWAVELAQRGQISAQRDWITVAITGGITT